MIIGNNQVDGETDCRLQIVCHVVKASIAFLLITFESIVGGHVRRGHNADRDH